ncbi:MAG: deoxyribonuclease IV [bacterium]|nr:MAG: deoxyribonuclease IV [bacterium]
MQIFTKNANQWKAAPLADDVVRRFREELDRSGITPVVSHDSYLINLASPNAELREKSVAAFLDELERAEKLGLLGVVTHPGAHVGEGEEAGLDRVAESLRSILEATRSFRVNILIENTAGQGTSLGWSMEHLAHLLRGVDGHARVGFCLDTCHLHAAGHDLTTDAGYEATIKAFDDAVGLDRLRCLHLNDSLKLFGSRVDRHTHIGQGTLGEEPFGRIMRDGRLAGVPKILETPKEGEGVAEDRMNLATLARLAAPPAGPGGKRKTRR